MKSFTKMIALALGCMLAAGLAGCGQGGGGGSQPDTIVTDVDPDTVGTITIGYKYENNEDKITDKLISSFKEKFPNVKVTATTFTGDTFTAIDRLNRGKMMPDIFMTNSFDMLAIDDGNPDLLLDLTPYIEQEEEAGTFDQDDYYSTWWKLGQRNFDGAQLMVPRAADRVVVHYNKEKIKEAERITGKEILKYIKNGWTWDDFDTVCGLLKESNLAEYIVDSNLDWEAVYNPILTHFGVKYFDDNGNLAIDSPETQNALDFFKAWADKGYIGPSKGASADFDNGKGFMIFQSRAVSTTLDVLRTKVWSTAPAATDWSEKYDIVTMPVFDGDERIGVGAAGYCASTKAKDPAIVWQFMKHIVSKEGQNAIAEVANYVPIRKDMADYTDPDNRWGKGYEKFNLSAFTYMSGNTEEEENWNCYTDYFLKKPVGYAVRLNTLFGDSLVGAYAYGKPFADTLTAFNSQLEKLLRT